MSGTKIFCDKFLSVAGQKTISRSYNKISFIQVPVYAGN